MIWVDGRCNHNGKPGLTPEAQVWLSSGKESNLVMVRDILWFHSKVIKDDVCTDYNIFSLLSHTIVFLTAVRV